MKIAILGALAWSSAGNARAAGAETETVGTSGAAPATAAEKRPTMILLSRIVGEVGDHVVTSREVRINDAVERAMADQFPEKTLESAGLLDPGHVLSGNEKLFPTEVGRVLDEWVVYLEAKTLSTQPVAKADIAAGIKAVQDFWGAKAAWQELEVAADELREMIERKLISKGFVKLKTDPNLAPISDDEALTYYRKNRLRFGSLPFSSFKDSIKAFLIKSQTERRLAEWRDVLRRKYKVRNLIAG